MRFALVLSFVALSAALFVVFDGGKPAVKMSAAQRLAEDGRSAEARTQPYLRRAGINSLPDRLALLAFKHERKLEVWAQKDSVWRPLKAYPILAASGKLGPKLREGDGQVPEGIYRLTYLNPNSNYHLSMKLDYPNRFDIAMGARNGRTNLGSDICIHGWEVSIGCIAIGNVAIEELYLLVEKTGMQNVDVIIAPNDLRRSAPLLEHSNHESWLRDLYTDIARNLQPFVVKTARRTP